jgi:hypothetical protein
LFTPHADRRRCGKPVTLPDNLRAGSKEIAVPAEPFKKLDVRGSGIRAGGHDRNTTPEYWIDGRRMRAAPKVRHSGKAMPSKL